MSREPGNRLSQEGIELCWLWLSAKENTSKAGNRQKTRVPSLGLEDPLEQEMATHSKFLFGKFHGQRSLAAYSLWSHRRAGRDLTTKQQQTVLLGCIYPYSKWQFYFSLSVQEDPSDWLLWGFLYVTSCISGIILSKSRTTSLHSVLRNHKDDDVMVMSTYIFTSGPDTAPHVLVNLILTTTLWVNTVAICSL